MLDFLTHRAILTAPPRLGQFSLTKELGAPIDFLWPCTNSGDADGVAFIKVTEGGVPLWDSPPFTIPPGLTVNTNLHQTITQALGLHNLIAELREGSPPTGSRVIMADTVALTVVSNPILAPDGAPTINGILGASSIGPGIRPNPYPLSWRCQNSGGGSGQARLRVVSAPLYVGGNVTGSLVPIPGFSTVNLLLSVPTFFTIGSRSYTVTLTMEDGAGAILGTWQFALLT